ncbi:MAG: type II toxin-antitoxin system RelE/ParE family toxin [Rhizobiales bacterium]|nr:type II toxin-antitoxin system RelE/ParE family toxin [Hyphomicrobiales bacterium]
MTRKVLWAPRAKSDYGMQLAYIAGQDPRAAQLVKERLDAAVGKIAENPLGRPNRVAGYLERSVPKTSLVIALELLPDGSVGITRIIHTARDWPANRWPSD